MKVVINSCYGGFSLSPLAAKRLAQLQGRDCFFYKTSYGGDKFKLMSKLEQVEKKLDKKEIKFDCMWFAFDVPNMEELYKAAKDKNKCWKEHYLTNRPDERSDPKLIQVVEELGDKANGDHAELKIIEIPDNIEYDIEEYDGIESIHQRHQSWS